MFIYLFIYIYMIYLFIFIYATLYHYDLQPLIIKNHFRILEDRVQNLCLCTADDLGHVTRARRSIVG